MAVQYSEIQELLKSRADLNARLSLYSVADIRVPARNPRIPHAHRGLLSQKYHCSAPLSSPAADAVYRSVRQHG